MLCMKAVSESWNRRQAQIFEKIQQDETYHQGLVARK